jgi:ribose transport system ATP-binding protein
METARILSLERITKSFSGTKALDDVSFDLLAGEVHCLVGENGAGKSTLIKILSGAEHPDDGQITVFGRSFRHLTPRDSLALGISTIYQDVDLVTTLSVADNIFLGHELLTPMRFVDSNAQVDAAASLLRRLAIDIEPRAIVEDLSPAKQQMLQIVKALHKDTRILVMDEPTSSLGHEESRALTQLVRTLAARGLGIIYISHHLEEVFELGDRITVLKDGRRVAGYDRDQVLPDQIVHAMVGREASLFYAKERVPIGDVIVEVRGMTRGEVVRDVSFDVRRGEVFGIGGLVGSGRSELLRLLFGADMRDAGRLLIDGVDATPSSPRAAIDRGICLISEDRMGDNLFPARPVVENVAVVRNERGGAWLRGERPEVGRLVEALRISLRTVQQEVGSLSGGNQQKSVLARWLLSGARLFLFDEPTKGVDVGAKSDIYGLLTDLARAGKTVIMVSSDLPELLSMSDRIGVMRAGRMIATVAREEADEALLMNLFLGMQEAA